MEKRGKVGLPRCPAKRWSTNFIIHPARLACQREGLACSDGRHPSKSCEKVFSGRVKNTSMNKSFLWCSKYIVVLGFLNSKSRHHLLFWFLSLIHFPLSSTSNLDMGIPWLNFKEAFPRTPDWVTTTSGEGRRVWTWTANRIRLQEEWHDRWQVLTRNKENSTF